MLVYACVCGRVCIFCLAGQPISDDARAMQSLTCLQSVFLFLHSASEHRYKMGTYKRLTKIYQIVVGTKCESIHVWFMND